jgi:hypothetical protein
MAKIGLIAFAIALLLTRASYAADKIVLVGSGTATYYWKGVSTDRAGPDGLVIDLDRGIVTWGDVAIPIVKTSGNFIEFESKEKTEALDSHTYWGTMDRVTGVVGISERWIRESSEPDDPEMKFPVTEEISYNLTCKRTNPVF